MVSMAVDGRDSRPPRRTFSSTRTRRPDGAAVRDLNVLLRPEALLRRSWGCGGDYLRAARACGVCVAHRHPRCRSARFLRARYVAVRRRMGEKDDRELAGMRCCVLCGVPV